MNYDIRKNTLEECLEHWSNPQDHNLAENYNGPQCKQRSKYLVSIFKKYKIPKNNILEIGCNCCRNLNKLHDHKYKNLTGIEISKKAIEKQKEFFPKLKVTLINNTIEDCILKFKDNQFETTFTMAVLQHIHIDSNWIFEHIARITNKNIILIEEPVRNYKKIFESYGFTLIDKRNCNKIEGLVKYKCFIFKKG